MRKAAFMGVGVLVFAAVVAGQSAAPPDATMQALLAEVKALRAEVNRAAGSSIRAQLLVARLQLQEQRILTVSRQIDEVQKELAGMAQARAGLEMILKQNETENPAVEREDSKAFGMFKQQLTEQHNREQQLRQQESSLAAMLAEEQARWTEFNARLDELERALATSRNR